MADLDRRIEERTDLVVLDDLAAPPARSSGVKSIRLSSVSSWISSGFGRVGNGCVGDSISPGRSEAATGRSSIGQIGWPVSRLNT